MFINGKFIWESDKSMLAEDVAYAILYLYESHSMNIFRISF